MVEITNWFPDQVAFLDIMVSGNTCRMHIVHWTRDSTWNLFDVYESYRYSIKFAQPRTELAFGVEFLW